MRPSSRQTPQRVAFISVHSCPLGRLGARDTGGMNVYLRELGRELGRRNIALDIFTRWHDYGHPRIEDLGAGVRLIHLHAGLPHPLPKEGLYPYLQDFVSELIPFQHRDGIEYDLVHSHYWLSGIVGEKLKEAWKVPHVATFHTLAKVKQEARLEETESPLRIAVEDEVMSAADMVIAFTEDEKARMFRLYGTPAEKIRVVPCGVNPELFTPASKREARRALGLSAGDRDVLLFVGRLEPLKGLDLLLQALAHLRSRKGLRLLIVGGDWQSREEVSRLRHMAFDLGVHDRVAFWGAVPQEMLPLFYTAASACVVPSYYESFGLVVLEALSCGTPVVASCTGGLRDVLENGRNGYLVESRDPSLFAGAIDQVLRDRESRRRMAEEAKASARQYSWSRVADGVLSGYRETLGRFRS